MKYQNVLWYMVYGMYHVFVNFKLILQENFKRNFISSKLRICTIYEYISLLHKFQLATLFLIAEISNFYWLLRN